MPTISRLHPSTPTSVPRRRRPRLLATTTAMLLAAGLLGAAAPAAQAASTPPGTLTGWGFAGDGRAQAPGALDGKDVIATAAGGWHSLALTSDGKVTAWAANNEGQANVPAGLTAGETVTAVDAGSEFSLALTLDGEVWGWGHDGWGQATAPSSLAGRTVTAIAAGYTHSVALTSDGEVTAWGNSGLGATGVPASLAGETVTAVAAGIYDGMALTSDGQVTAWGYNEFGQTDVPTSLTGKTVTAIAAGGMHNLALTSDGQVTAWGYNDYGQTDVPTSLIGKTVTAIDAGENHSIALTSDGRVTAWGINSNGESAVPASLADTWVTDISGGSYHSLAIYAQGFTDGPVAGITGEARVDEALTAETGTPSPTPDSYDYRWFADGTVISGQTGSTFTPTTAQAGAVITVEVSAVKDGYVTATDRSDAVGPVEGGHITLPTPTITGSAVVDGSLTAALPAGLAPADATIAWTWFRGATQVGTGGSYQPVPDDVGSTLTASATATKDHHDDATAVSAATEAVVNATFSSPPVATISGTAKVGHTLSAGTGTIAPTADAVAYQWYADGGAIIGATDPTFELAGAQRHTAVTVRVTATRDGYDDADDTSDPTGDVAAETAPELTFAVSDSAIRLGQDTTLDWETVDADTVTASAAWTGSKPASGTASVSPADLGQTTYVLTATNTNGSTTGQVNVTVGRPAQTLVIHAPRGPRLAGTAIRVTAGGLDAGEPYALHVAGSRVAIGDASATGRLSRTIALPPSSWDRAAAAVTVTGSESDRRATTTTQIVVNKTLGLQLAKSVVRPRHRQWVAVRGFVPGEHVTLAYRGVPISYSNARAGADGVYRAWFRVFRHEGTRTVTVTGAFPGRTSTTTFRVKRF